MGKINEDNNTASLKGLHYKTSDVVEFIADIVSVITAGWFVVQWLYTTGNFPIRKVELVNQLKHQKSTELQRAAANAIDGGFFSMNVDAFREELLLLPWVKNVSVRKVWPDKLLVAITERTPIVRWASVDAQSMNQTSNKATDKNTGRQILLSEEGVVFTPEVTQQQQVNFSKLSLFSGPHKSADKVLKQCMQFRQIVNTMNTKIERCSMDARHAWEIELATRLVLNLGKNDVIDRLQRFVNVFSQQLDQYLQYVAYADLRYSNGFSVKWIGHSAAQTDGMRLN